jgi:hypothetical protein
VQGRRTRNEEVRRWKCYPRLALRPARAEESAAFEGMDSSPFRRLGVVLDSPEHTGLVACGRVTVRRSDADDGSSWGSGDVLAYVVAP